MRSDAHTVADYVANLPADRRESIEVLRKELKSHLDPRLEEVMQYGMITYVVPHRIYPAGYHRRPADPLPYLALASQKNNLALYLMSIYADPQLSAWLDTEWQATGQRLDRGKSCLRFRSHREIPFEVLGELLRKVDIPTYLQLYERSLKTSTKTRGTKRPARSRPTAGGQHVSAKDRSTIPSVATEPETERSPAKPRGATLQGKAGQNSLAAKGRSTTSRRGRSTDAQPAARPKRGGTGRNPKG